MSNIALNSLILIHVAVFSSSTEENTNPGHITNSLSAAVLFFYCSVKSTPAVRVAQRNEGTESDGALGNSIE